METLKDFIFVDCVLIDFSVDKLVSTITVVTESYYPECNRKRHKGVIKLLFKNITEFTVWKSIEFDSDIQLNLEKDRYNDSRANEVYYIKETFFKNSLHNVELDSDFLKLTILCSQIEIKKE
jgi:hypothetical protein